MQNHPGASAKWIAGRSADIESGKILPAGIVSSIVGSECNDQKKAKDCTL
mgnify:CR=1 FL=1